MRAKLALEGAFAAPEAGQESTVDLPLDPLPDAEKSTLDTAAEIPPSDSGQAEIDPSDQPQSPDDSQ